MGPKIEQILGLFWVYVGSTLGSVLGLEWAKMRQDDSNEDIKSLKVPRSIIFKKCDFTMAELYFLRLGGSQEEYERFRKAAPKRHLKSFNTSKERVPNMEPKKQFLNQIWSRNGPRNGTHLPTLGVMLSELDSASAAMCLFVCLREVFCPEFICVFPIDGQGPREI